MARTRLDPERGVRKIGRPALIHPQKEKLQRLMEVDRIGLIVCDVDGTVAIDGQVVSPELRGIFATLAERGVAATLATGRTLHHSKAVADALGLDGYLICSEGGCVVSADGTNYIHHADMDTEAIAQVVDY